MKFAHRDTGLCVSKLEMENSCDDTTTIYVGRTNDFFSIRLNINDALGRLRRLAINSTNFIFSSSKMDFACSGIYSGFSFVNEH